MAMMTTAQTEPEYVDDYSFEKGWEAAKKRFQKTLDTRDQTDYCPTCRAHLEGLYVRLRQRKQHGRRKQWGPWQKVRPGEMVECDSPDDVEVMQETEFLEQWQSVVDRLNRLEERLGLLEARKGVRYGE